MLLLDLCELEIEFFFPTIFLPEGQKDQVGIRNRVWGYEVPFAVFVSYISDRAFIKSFIYLCKVILKYCISLNLRGAARASSVTLTRYPLSK